MGISMCVFKEVLKYRQGAPCGMCALWPHASPSLPGPVHGHSWPPYSHVLWSLPLCDFFKGAPCLPPSGSLPLCPVLNCIFLSSSYPQPGML